MRCAAAALLLLASLTACNSGSDGAIPVSVIGPRAAIGSPNLAPLSAPAATLSSALTQGLVAFDAKGEIEPGLAERWIVTDDGLSYIFRIKRTTWSDGREVTAPEVAASLKASLGPKSRNPLKPMLGGISDIVAMTDRVIEIRLAAPQAGMFQLLAQPEMAIVRAGRGTGPYRIKRRDPNAFLLEPVLARDAEVDPEAIENATRTVRGDPAPLAIARYAAGSARLVTAGSFDDLAYVRAATIANAQLRRDLASGLFGFRIATASKALADRDRRRALAMAIDRNRLPERLDAQNWRTSDSLLPGPIEGGAVQAKPAWSALSQPDRIAEARRLTAGWRSQPGGAEVRVDMPAGPGGRILFAQLAADWNAIGVRLIRVRSRREADLVLIDRVAPVASASWYLGQFACPSEFLCSSSVNFMTEVATNADPVERAATRVEADQAIGDAQLFIPLAMPLRWSLVAPRLVGFRENALAVHPLNRLRKVSN